MPYEVPVFDLGMFTTVTDLSAQQFHAVKIGTTGYIEVCGAGETSIGILKDNNIGNATKPIDCQVAVLGIFPAMFGAAVASYMTALTPDSTGRLVTATTSDVIVAYALETGTTGDIKSVMILPRMAAGTLPSAAVGAIAYSTGAGWTGLAAGTAGKMLVAKGALAPAWGSAVGENTLSIPVTLSGIVQGNDIVTAFTPGFAGTYLGMSAVVTTADTSTAKTATIIAKIGSTATTGGVLSLTSAGCTPLGKVTASTAATALNTFGASDTISINTSALTGPFNGVITLLIRIQPTLGGV